MGEGAATFILALGILAPILGTIWFILTIILFFKIWAATNRVKIGLLSLQDIQHNVRDIADALDKKTEVKESISSGNSERDAAIDRLVRAKYEEGWDK